MSPAAGGPGAESARQRVPGAPRGPEAPKGGPQAAAAVGVPQGPQGPGLAPAGASLEGAPAAARYPATVSANLPRKAGLIVAS